MNYEVTRGDTHTFKFQRRNSAGEPVTDTPINIWFTVKNSANSRTILIQKRVSNGSIVYDNETQYYRFTLFPADTDILEIGQEYRFDIEVKTAAGIRTIAKGSLTITEEVTHAADEVMDDG
jgi:hypothetical protein|nr:MAG TPA: hypothetical protein [Caudoviricetes sp.]DAY92588.1 MAG TPA: hypothetical protein [Caudoviricetes sp.]